MITQKFDTPESLIVVVMQLVSQKLQFSVTFEQGEYLLSYKKV